MKYRVLLDVSYRDMLVEADNEEEAKQIVFETFRKLRPFGGYPSKQEVRLRAPWKKQLEKANDTE